MDAGPEKKPPAHPGGDVPEGPDEVAVRDGDVDLADLQAGPPGGGGPRLPPADSRPENLEFPGV